MDTKRVAAFGAVVLLLVLGAGCATMAVWSAPAKTASEHRTPDAVRADELFWRTLHGGAYDRIPEALVALKAAYLANPNDAMTAAHIGRMHIWRLAERARLTPLGPDITDHAVLSRKYFEEAVRLNPREPRYLGFYASLLMAEGTIHRDEKLVRRGYYTMRDAVAAWPEFNYFTSGYIASGLAPVRQMTDRGVAVALGTDNLGVNDDEDLLQEARLAQLLHSPPGLDLRPLSAETVLAWATERGAAVLGPPQLGRLEAGAPADLVLARLALVERAIDGPDSVAPAVVQWLRPSSVDTVMVAGRVVVRDGRYVLRDRDEIERRAYETVRRWSQSTPVRC